MGRFRLGILPAHRYGLYGLAAYVSLFMLALPAIAALWERRRPRGLLLWGGCLLGVALLVQQVAVGKFAAERAEYFAQLEQRILNGERDPAVTHDIFPDRQLLEEQYRIMREQKIYMFSTD
jgi:hypothetical protein